MSFSELFPMIKESVSDYEWHYTLHLMDMLEEKTGGEVIPVTNFDNFIGFALMANDRIVSMVEHQEDDSLSDTIDALGYMFFHVYGSNRAEA
tara:strand:+ start:17807 stop:18082 length:276 start_codon:yes stop_codon:yes gene_type:complete